MKLSMSLMLVLSSFFVYAQNPEPQSLEALSTQLKGHFFQLFLKPGYHFNYKAPNGLQSDGEVLFPVLKNPRRMDFRLQTKKLASSYAEVYVCDDAVTFCETLSVALSTQSPARRVDVSKFAKPEAAASKEERSVKSNAHPAKPKINPIY